MPLDIQLFREFQGGNPELIRESQRKRFASVELVDEIIAKDEKWRYLTGSIDDMRKRRNKIQKEEVAAKMKAGQKCDEELAKIKKIDEEIIAAEAEQKDLKIEIDKMVSKVGNIVESGVPVSQDEDKDNLVMRKWGTPRDPAGLLNHHDLLWRIGGYEPDRGSNVAGHKGYFLRDVGVLLNQAFINYGIAFLRKRQYTMVQPPFFMKKEIMAGVAQLEEFDEALYKVSGDGGDEKYLIATSEQPLCGYHMDEWLEEKSLPLLYGGVSTCFRKEAGSSGKDVWGIFRVHQFEKVEQFVLVEGDLEKSIAMQEEMIATAEEFYQSLGFPYHVINIVSGALNNAAIKKYDLECWFPGYNSYRELVSCSNCTDYQARSMGIRCGIKKLGDREKKYVHMLNATLCATGRAICCLLETYQDVDGVHVPEVLVPFMGGITFLPFVRDTKLSIEKSLGDGDKKQVTQQKATPGQQQQQQGGGGGGGSKDKKKDNKEEKKTAPTPTAASTTNTTSTPAATSAPTHTPATTTAAAITATESLSPEEKVVVDKITAVGNAIRDLKAAKASKDQITPKVEELLALKNEYKALTGKDYTAPATATATGGTPSAVPAAAAKKEDSKKPKDDSKKPKDDSKKPKEDKPKEDKKPKKEAPPKPAKTAESKPAVIKSTSTVSIPTINEVVTGNAVNLQLLDTRLKSYSYCGGYALSKEDNRIFELLVSTINANEITKYINIQRWYRHIGSFNSIERDSWA